MGKLSRSGSAETRGLYTAIQAMFVWLREERHYTSLRQGLWRMGRGVEKRLIVNHLKMCERTKGAGKCCAISEAIFMQCLGVSCLTLIASMPRNQGHLQSV